MIKSCKESIFVSFICVFFNPVLKLYTYRVTFQECDKDVGCQTISLPRLTLKAKEECIIKPVLSRHERDAVTWCMKSTLESRELGVSTT